ncbi:MAG: FecR domain-containing protein [Deltaproteobacteria bacterium]|nr:FecR domain-containing protein [Deltaproteobacteria bacterium]
MRRSVAPYLFLPLLTASFLLTEYSHLNARERPVIGSIRALKGQAMILSEPEEFLPQGDPTRVLHESYYWKSRPAKTGASLQLQDTIVCYKGCQLRASFRNAYTLVLASGSSIRLGRQFLSKPATSPDTIDLIFGSLRALILKDPDRQEALPEFRTRSSVLGVRGTDFVMTTDQAKTVISVLTGEISLRSAIPALFQKEQKVSAGMTSEVMNPPEHLTRIHDKEALSDIKSLLPSAPVPIRPEQLTKISQLSKNMIPDDPHLTKLSKKIIPHAKVKVPPPFIQRELRTPTLLGGLSISRGPGEIEIPEDPGQHPSLSMGSVNILGEYLPLRDSGIPVSIRMRFSKFDIDDGRHHFGEPDFQVYNADGEMLSAGIGYWFMPTRALFLTTHLHINIMSRFELFGEHRPPPEEGGYHNDRNIGRVIGGGLSLGLIWPFTEHFAFHAEAEPGEFRTMHLPSRKFRAFRMTLGILFQADSFFSEKTSPRIQTSEG